MNFALDQSYGILLKTPVVIQALLGGLSSEWLEGNEGPDTFSPFDVVGHLIHGEKTDWIPRIKIILALGNTKTFDVYDRFAQFEESKGKSIQQLLDSFEILRKENISWLQSQHLSAADLEKTGMHPGLGEVTLKNLVAAWVVHDLTHIAQIGRVMAKQYKEEIGPWSPYFRILNF
jgi:DinB superfamily